MPNSNILMYTTEDALNKIATAYLDIAEVQALNHEPMYMKDWLQIIDDYLKMTRREILTTKGSVSHQQAIEKAHAEHNGGMNVSSLYIAQVKRKCGLKLGEDFNLTKSEDARQPQCPKDKEEAIVLNDPPKMVYRSTEIGPDGTEVLYAYITEGKIEKV